MPGWLSRRGGNARSPGPPGENALSGRERGQPNCWWRLPVAEPAPAPRQPRHREAARQQPSARFRRRDRAEHQVAGVLHAGPQHGVRASEHRQVSRVVEQRDAWFGRFAAVRVHDLVFLDEFGAATNMARGRGPRGRRVVCRVPHGHWKTVSTVAAMTAGGVLTAVAYDGPVDTESF